MGTDTKNVCFNHACNCCSGGDNVCTEPKEIYQACWFQMNGNEQKTDRGEPDLSNHDACSSHPCNCNEDGVCTDTHERFMKCPHKTITITGFYQPPKSSRDWLKQHQVERTGECRVPKSGELFEPLGAHGVTDFESGPMLLDKSELCGQFFSNHRWILRRQPASPAEKAYPVRRHAYGDLRIEFPNSHVPVGCPGSISDPECRTLVGYRFAAHPDYIEPSPVRWLDPDGSGSQWTTGGFGRTRVFAAEAVFQR